MPTLSRLYHRAATPAAIVVTQTHHHNNRLTRLAVARSDVPLDF
jgi:hypothetical protein